MSQNQGWGQPPSGPGWEQQQPPQSPPPPPGEQPPQWAAPPPPGQPGGPTKYCPACGSTIDARSLDCPRCGVRQPDAVYQEPKSRPLAILLALLLGGLGIHRFYVGPISWGIAYLVFFWTGIPQLLAWLEAIYWLTRSDVEWAQKYGGPVRESNGCAIGCLWVIALMGLIGLGLSLLVLASLGGLIFLGGEISEILSEIEQNLYTPTP